MPTRTQKTVSTKKGSAKGALEQKTRELGVLHRITEQISSNLELEVVLKEIVEMVVEITQADACLLYLLDETQKELTLRASKNPHPKLIGRIRLELGEGITGWVAKEKDGRHRQRRVGGSSFCAVP
ncbi:MAG: GAF domain-containing protein [Candidatus Manganitrophus sp.]|nr:MAG: GAF domain-containing protein [Candidatus Manganitrophus sp.]